MSRSLSVFAVFATCALILLPPGCGDAPDAPRAGRSALLLERGRVELLEGFEGHDDFVVWHDYLGSNTDRDELVLLMPREGRLRWRTAGAGTLHLGAARWQLGPSGDDTPLALRVEALDAAGAVLQSLALEPPPLPPAPEAAAVAEREGEVRRAQWTLPARTTTLEFTTHSPTGAPAGAYVALLAPWIERDGPVSDSPLVPGEHFASQWLTALLEKPGEPVPFGLRLSGSPEAPDEEAISLPAVDDAGAFTGRTARHSLALVDRAVFECSVDLSRPSWLRGALALDERMPSGARGVLRVSVDGEALAELAIDSTRWRAVEVALPRKARGTLRLELVPEPFEPELVVRSEPDFEVGEPRPVGWRAGVLRVGFSEARVDSPRRRPARKSGRAAPSVLVLHVETLRADVLSPYGGDPAVTPNLSAFASRSTRYAAAIAPSPWTLPSTATLLTGLPPTAHGVIDHDRAVLPTGLVTLAEAAREGGLRTAAVVTNVLLRPDAGYARGFDDYVFVPHANARQVNHLAQTWLLANAGAPVLVFLHYFDPHHPFVAPGEWRNRFVEPELTGLDMHAATLRLRDRLLLGEAIDPEEEDVRFLRQRYPGEVAYLDHQLGELFAWLDRSGLAESTAVVLTADHGEEFFEHGLLGHGSQLYDETVRVPLFIAPPGALVGWTKGPRAEPAPHARVVERVASTSGLFKEVLEILGLEPPSGIGAQAAVVESTSRALGLAFTETNKGLALGAGGDILRRPLRALRSDTHLLVETLPLPDEDDGPRLCLFDLRSDPGALVPLPPLGEEADRLRRALGETLAYWLERQVRAPSAGGDRERLADLAALGYLHAPSDQGTLPGCDH